jgi:hypothetical protein
MSAVNATQPFPPTTRTEERRHTTADSRGLGTTPASSTETGRFGRMFRHLPVFSHDIAHLQALAATMVGEPATEDTPLGGSDDEENVQIPAGYTYLGQFIDHDITFDPVSSLTRQNDPNALNNFRTPRLDLDSLYGRGPSDQPFLYQPGGLLLAFEGNGDLQRNAYGRALLGDPRNDENQIVAQIQLLFIRFHNRMVEAVVNDELDGINSAGLLTDEDRFKEAQRQVRWHYQWLVIHDFLRRVVGKRVIKDILPKGKYRVGGRTIRLVCPRFLFYHWREDPFIPVEFSVAAYRFGHSMIRPSYHLNPEQRARTEPRGKKGRVPFRIRVFGAPYQENLNGFGPLPLDDPETPGHPNHRIDWRFFFDFGDKTRDGAGKKIDMVQPSYKIDPLLSEPLADLRQAGVVNDLPTSLAERNLIRGLQLGLPSGQAVALAMGITPLGATKLDIAARTSKQKVNGKEQEIPIDVEAAEALEANTPLWFYILREAEVVNDGARLGPVGARIVAEVIIGLIAADPLSYLGVQPNWRPDPLLANGDGEFGMKELIRFVGA